MKCMCLAGGRQLAAAAGHVHKAPALQIWHANFWELHSRPINTAPPPLTPAAISKCPLGVSITTFHQSKYASVSVTTMHVKARVVSRLELNESPRASRGQVEKRYFTAYAELGSGRATDRPC